MGWFPVFHSRRNHPKNTQKKDGLIQKIGVCPECQGRMKIIRLIEGEEVIEKILKHLGLWDVKVQLPPKGKATPLRIPYHYLPFHYFLSFISSLPTYAVGAIKG
jgi:hypothetical protein